MITELNDIKEVKIITKENIKYFMLFEYDSEANTALNRYFLLTHSTMIEDVESYKENWVLSEGHEFRGFSVSLPS